MDDFTAVRLPLQESSQRSGPKRSIWVLELQGRGGRVESEWAASPDEGWQARWSTGAFCGATWGWDEHEPRPQGPLREGP